MFSLNLWGEQHEKDRTELKQMGFDNGSDNPLMRNSSAQSVQKMKEIINSKMCKDPFIQLWTGFFPPFSFPRSQTEGKFNFEPDYKVTWSSSRENHCREGAEEKRYRVVASTIPCLPSSVNHFFLWWAVRSHYYSNYPKQKNSRGEKEDPVS